MDERPSWHARDHRLLRGLNERETRDLDDATSMEHLEKVARGALEELLVFFGERRIDADAIDSALARARALVPANEDRLGERSGNAHRATEQLAADIEAIRTFSLGASDASADSFARSKKRFEIEIRVVNDAYDLLSAIAPPTPKAIGGSFPTGHTIVAEALHADRSVTATMDDVIRRLAEITPEADWTELARLPYEREIELCAGYASELAKSRTVPPRLRGLWVGLFTGFVDGGLESYRAYISGLRTASPSGHHWPSQQDWRPRDGSMRSTILRAIYEAGEIRARLDSGAALVALAYVTLLARAMGRHYEAEVGPLERITSGWDDGGWLDLKGG